MEESLWGKFFEAISYYNDEEDPLHDTIVMDGWDDLTPEEQRNYVKSMLSGMGIAFSIAGGFLLTNYFVGEALEVATDEVINFISTKTVDYFSGMDIPEFMNTIIDNLSDDDENLNVLLEKLSNDPDFLSEFSKEVFFDEKTFDALKDVGRHLVDVRKLETQGVVYDVSKWIGGII